MTILGKERFFKKKIIKRVRRLLRLKSIFASQGEYDKYRMAQGKANGLNEVVELLLRDAGTFPVYARVRSSDLTVLADTFEGRYHVPLGYDYPVRTILDLGCNVGYTLRHYATIYPQARLFGVEMDPGNYRLALRNTEHLPQCSIANYAVWYENTAVHYSGADQESFHITGSEGEEAEARTIDSIMNYFGVQSVDLMKIDIEGAEEKIFRGDTGWMHSAGAIILEVHNGDLDMYISKLLREGFECHEHPEHWSSIWAVRKQNTDCKQKSNTQ